MAACSTVVAVDIMRDDVKNFPNSCFSFFGGGEAILRDAM